MGGGGAQLWWDFGLKLWLGGLSNVWIFVSLIMVGQILTFEGGSGYGGIQPRL